MALGDAYINIHADTSKFKAELAEKLRTPLAEIEKERVTASKNTVAAQEAVAKSAVKTADIQVASTERAIAAVGKLSEAERAASRERVAAEKAAASVANQASKERIAASNAEAAVNLANAKAIETLAEEAARVRIAAAKEASKVQILEAKEAARVEIAASKEAASAATDASRERVAAAKIAATAEAAAAREGARATVAAEKAKQAALKETEKARRDSLRGGNATLQGKTIAAQVTNPTKINFGTLQGATIAADFKLAVKAAEDAERAISKLSFLPGGTLVGKQIAADFKLAVKAAEDAERAISKLSFLPGGTLVGKTIAAEFQAAVKAAEDADRAISKLSFLPGGTLQGKTIAAEFQAALKAAEDADRAISKLNFLPGGTLRGKQIADDFKAASAASKKAADDKIADDARALKSAKDASAARVAAEKEAGKKISKISADTAQQALGALRLQQAASAAAIRAAAGGEGTIRQRAASTAGAARQSLKDQVQRIRVVFSESGASQVRNSIALVAAEARSLNAALGGLPGRGISATFGAISSGFDAIITSAKFATVGVIALGAALAGIGLVAGAKLQNAKIAFAALANEIQNGDTKIQEFGEAASKAIGDKFTQDLRNLALQSSLTFSSLQSVSQQLLSLGFNGEQTKSAIIDVGNALAASGKTGGELNDDLRGVFVAISQIRGAGRLLAQDLNQITTRIPALTRSKLYLQLAKNLGLVEKAATKLTAAQSKNIQKLAKEGEISDNQALLAIDQQLKKISGAGIDAKGLNALQRTNKSLAGQFEQFKETIRNSLADIFDEKFTNKLADQITNFLPKVQKAIASAGPALRNFVQTTVNILEKSIVPLADAITTVFNALSLVLDKIGPKIPALISGFASIFTVIANIASSDFGHRLGDTFSALGGALVQIGDALKAAAPFFGVVAAAALDLADIALSLGPELKGVGDALGVIGLALSPLVPLLDGLKAGFDFLPDGFGETIGIVAASLAAMVVALLAVPAAAATASAAIALLEAQLEILAVVLSTIGVTEVIAIIVAVGLALTALAAQFDSFRNALVVTLFGISKATTETFGAILYGIQKVLEGLAKAGSFGGKLNPFHKLGKDAGDAARSIASTRKEIVASSDALLTLKASSDKAGAAITDSLQASQSSILEFNRLAVAAGENILGASATVGQLNAAIAALPTEKRFQFIIDIVSENDAFLKTTKGLTKTEDFGFGTSQASIDKLSETLSAQDIATNATDDFLKKLRGSIKAAGGGSADVGGKNGAGSTSKASDLRDRLKNIFDGLREEIAKASSAHDVRDTIKKLRDALKDALDIKKLPDKVAERLQRQNKRLQKLVEERASILKRLDDAKAASDKAISDVSSFANITSAFDELNKSIEGTTGSLADLSRLRIIKPGQDTLNIAGTLGTAATAAQVNGDKLDAILKARLKAIQDFQADLAAIIKRGVNRNLVQQIVDAGVSGGAATADALANASNATIASINATQKQIDAAAKQLGSTAGDVAASVGENVVLGIVKQLKAQKGALTDAITDLVNVIIKRLKKGLGIKSPSTKTGWVGMMTAKGLINALRAHVPHVGAAAAALAKAAIPKLAAVNVDPIGEALAKAEFAPVSVDALLRLANSQALEGLQATLDAAAQTAKAPAQPAIRVALDEGQAERRHAEMIGAIRDGHIKPAPRVFQPTPPPVLAPRPAMRTGGVKASVRRGLR